MTQAARSASHAASSSQVSADYIKQLPSPKNSVQQQEQVVQNLVNTFNKSFKQDCDAKAHQLNYLGQQLGAHPDLNIFQSFCAEIGE